MQVRAAQRKQIEEANERKRQETEARINAAKQAQADSLKEQLEMFAEKERKSQEKREQFDKMRHEKQEELRRQAEEKNRHMQRLMDTLAQKEEEKLQAYARADAEAQERLRVLQEEQRREEERRRAENEAKAQAQERKRTAARELEEQKKRDIVAAKQRQEQHLAAIHEEKEAERLLVLEKGKIAREEKARAVERLKRIEQFNTEQMMQKIDEDGLKLREMEERKGKIKRQQARLKQEQEMQKKAIADALERMKRTHRWEPPEGIDMDIDVDALQQQVDAELGPPPSTAAQASTGAVGTAGPSRSESSLTGAATKPSSSLPTKPKTGRTTAGSSRQTTASAASKPATAAGKAKTVTAGGGGSGRDAEGVGGGRGKDDLAGGATLLGKDKAEPAGRGLAPVVTEEDVAGASHADAGGAEAAEHMSAAADMSETVGKRVQVTVPVAKGEAEDAVAAAVSDGAAGAEATHHSGTGQRQQPSTAKPLATAGVKSALEPQPPSRPHVSAYGPGGSRSGAGTGAGRLSGNARRKKKRAKGTSGGGGAGGGGAGARAMTEDSVGSSISKMSGSSRRQVCVLSSAWILSARVPYARCQLRAEHNQELKHGLLAQVDEFIIQELRRKQNERLLSVLEEEQEAEQARALMLKAAADDEDPARAEELGQHFALARAKASERIMRITAEHETVLVQRMEMLGLA